MAYSLYDGAVTPCVLQLTALTGIIDMAAAHCAANKFEERAFLNDRLYPDMWCLAREIRGAVSYGMQTPGRLAGMVPPALVDEDDASFAAAKSRVETGIEFLKMLKPEQFEGAEDKLIVWSAGAGERKLKGIDYLQQWGMPNFYFFVTTAYDILRHRGVPLGKRHFVGQVNWLK